MAHQTRRAVLAAGATLMAGVALRKLGAQDAEAPHVQMRPFSDIERPASPTKLPTVGFTTLGGKPVALHDFAGRPVVLNFWATWCTPCVAELPELDRLAGSDPSVTVLIVSADRGGAAVVRPFAAAHGLTHATILLDPGSDAVHALSVAGFPTTLLIGADGTLRGTLEGPASWGTAAGTIAGIVG